MPRSKTTPLTARAGESRRQLTHNILLVSPPWRFWPPKEVDFGNGNRILWVYDAGGAKLRKTVYFNDSGTVYSTTTDYIGGIVYTEKVLDFFSTAEGRVEVEDNQGAVNYQYQYYLKDQLGNTRVSFADVDEDGSLTTGEILQDISYYPFGMRLAGAALNYNSGSDNKYLYNGKEFEEEHGLNWYHYGARYYDPQLGRWWAVDPADEFYSPYCFVHNDPINFLDINGFAEAAFNYRMFNQTNYNRYRKYMDSIFCNYSGMPIFRNILFFIGQIFTQLHQIADF